MADLSIPTFSYQTLTPLYTTGAKLGSSQHAAILRNGLLKEVLDGGGVIPPWQVEQPTVADGELVQSIFSAKPLIDPEDPLFNREDLTDDYKNLFALWKGLDKLNQIAEFAKTDKRANNMRDILDQQFANKTAEIFKFLENSTFNDVTLIQGLKQQTLESGAKRPDTTGTNYSYYGFPLVSSQTEYYGATASTVRADPVAGLTGTETFTIAVTENGATTNVAIDLANVTGTLNIDNIVNYINTQLTAAGNIATTFGVKRDNEFSYSIQANLSTGEEVSFTSGVTGQEAAVYMAGSFGSGDLSGGLLTKLDNLAAASPNEAFRTDINTSKADSASDVAVDSQGNVYVVGSTAGKLDDQLIQGSSDLYLNKYDAAGTLIWSRLLGAADSASGFAVAVDSTDNVVVAGQTSSPLTSSAYGGNSDTFVTKFDSTGQEQWTRQASPYANDGALGLDIDSTGNIFVTGFTRSAFASGLTYNGGRDAFVTKLDTTGTLQYNKQFGTAGEETATAVKVDNAGNLFVAFTSDTSGLVRKYADSAINNPALFEASLGAVGSNGGITGLDVDGAGNVYVTGYSSNASLNGTVATAHSGGIDGFVTSLNDSTGAINWLSYVGTASDDKALGVTVNGTDVYLTGLTNGQLAGATQVGGQDSFVAKLNNTGVQQWAHQVGGAFATQGAALAFDSTGTSVLTELGLREGKIPGDSSGTVVSQTTARAGQQFTLSINGAQASTIEIANSDSFQWLGFKIQQKLGESGTAYIEENGNTQYLVIKATNGARVDIGHGPKNFDALDALGLREATLYGEAGTKEQLQAQKSQFELGFVDGLNLLTSTAAEQAGDIITNAQRVTRKAFDFLLHGPDYDPKNTLPPAISQQMAEKISAMESTLAFLQSLPPVSTANSLKLKI